MNFDHMSNLQQRFLFGVPMAAIAFAATWAGGLWFLALVLLVGFFTLQEWLVITQSEKGKNAWYLPACLVMLLGIALGPKLIMGSFALTPTQLVFVLAIGAFVGSFLKKTKISNAVWPTLGVLYIGFAVIGLVSTRGTSTLGLISVCYLFLIVWGTDVMAYFTGRAIGGPKLAPKISPGKTWSGAIGGAVSAAILGGILFSVTDTVSFWQGALGAVALSIVSQLGDLFESWIKRKNGVKDASNLIPGHGGIFDRVDGLLPVAIVAYFLHLLIAV